MMMLGMIWLLAPFVLAGLFVVVTGLLGAAVVIGCYVREKRIRSKSNLDQKN
jgi:hypothetical protein